MLIDANRDYYSMSRVPEFWDWLVNSGKKGLVKIPIEVYEEIKDGKKEAKEIDLLASWARDEDVCNALLFQEECIVELVSKIINEGYASDLADNEVEQIGQRSFLIAYTLVSPIERCIVTTESI